MKKYTFINTALFRGNVTAPLYKVFDTETRELYYSAHIYGKNPRGIATAINSFSSPFLREVKAWRQSNGVAG